MDEDRFLELPVDKSFRSEPPLVGMKLFLESMVWGRLVFPQGIPSNEERAAAKNNVEFVYIP